MHLTFTKSFLILIIFFTSSCGFKVLDNNQKNNFIIKEIKTFGDKRVNFKIKNNILRNSLGDGKKIIKVTLTTKKSKNIKEKNIKNEITKYEIRLNSSIVFALLEDKNDYTINVAVKGDYSVDDSYSSTLNNEKKLIDNLVNEISDKISDRIVTKLNAF
jgi:outer membrane lipopolysaccharide assembly protein LptE/RlpB